MRIDPAGNIYGLASDFTPSMPTQANVIYTETDTGRQKIGVAGKTYGELSHTNAGAAGLKRTMVANDSITLSSVYQDILSYTPTSHLTIQGWVNVSAMETGDIVMIEVSLNSNVHSLLQYSNSQVMSILHVDSIIVGSGDTYKVRVKQSAGTTNKSIGFKFFTEE